MSSTSITIKTPGRVCLFGDHQDYLKLPVIACAIDRYVTLNSKSNDQGVFQILLPDINEHLIIPLDVSNLEIKPDDLWCIALRVLKRYGISPDRGYNLCITGDLPINAGVSSSSAVVIAWVHFLLKAFADLEITTELLANLAYEIEVLEPKSPGGKMDQFTIAHGGMVFIDTSEETTIQSLDASLPGMVLGESGIPKQTISTLGELRGLAQKAIQIIKEIDPDFSIAKQCTDSMEKWTQHLPKDLIPVFLAAVTNHNITLEAYKALKCSASDMNKIGALMNQHHEQLRDRLQLTVPLIDNLISASLKAGALGAKIVGSGGGGSIVALCKPEDREVVAKAMIGAGAVAAYPISVSEGSKIIHE